ncbi:MAG TPA: hypothetical protein ACYCC8_00430 [Candidatus Azoamicus sp.]
MLRYINLIILAGGKSNRMGFCKINIIANKINSLEEKINISMNMGFFFLI